MERQAIWMISLAVAGTLIGSAARAQPHLCDGEPSVTQRAAAQELHARGQKLLDAGRFGAAAEIYRDSLQHWPHARVHLRTGVAFMNALRVLDAYHHISEALRCDRGTLKPHRRMNALERLELLRTRLAEIEVDCPEPGAQVWFNDESWFACPGRERRVVVAGQYVVKVTKPGHYTVLKPVKANPTKHVLVEPVVLSMDEGTMSIRRWSAWKPWVVLGASLAMGMASAGLQRTAYRRMDEYRAGVPWICTLDCARRDYSALERVHDRAIVENRVAVSGLVASAATLVVGLVLLYTNRSRKRPRPEAGSAKVRLMSMPVRAGAGGAIGLTF